MYSHDSFWHVERLMNMVSLLPEQFPVRWSPTLDHGFGIPLFNFTYPAPYYLGSLLMFLGVGPVRSYYALLFLAYFLGGLGIYLLGRQRPLTGFLAAVLYLLTPYQFLDLFVRGALGEVFALGLIPWVLLALENLSLTGRFKWYTSLPFALLILSHNFFAYLFLGLLIFFTLAIYRHKLLILLSLLYSACLSSFFLLPAFIERSYLLITQEKAHTYVAHFVHPRQLIYSKWIYLGSVIGESNNEMSFQLGVANLVILVLALAYLLYRLIKRHSLAKLPPYLIALGLAIYLTLPHSAWLWERIPLMSSLQFPWRFLGVTAILFALIYLELAAHFKSGRGAKSFLVFSALLVALAYYNTRNYHYPVKWMNEAEYLQLHYEYAGQNTTANREELVPLWAVKERYQPGGNALQLEGGAELIDKQESALSLIFSANAGNAQARAVYYKNYYPSWTGTVDGEKLELSPTPTGEITFPLLPGEHRYELKITETKTATAGNYITLLSLILLPFVAYLSKSKQLK